MVQVERKRADAQKARQEAAARRTQGCWAAFHSLSPGSPFLFGPLGIKSLERKAAGGGGEAPAGRGAKKPVGVPFEQGADDREIIAVKMLSSPGQ